MTGPAAAGDTTDPAPDPAPAGPPPGPPEAGGSGAAPVPVLPDRPAARFRSPRRLPAALTALAVLAVSAPFLYDVAAVRAHRPGMHWRRSLAERLEHHTLDDPSVLAGAVLLLLLGALLLFLAFAPGLRSLLPMAGGGELRAGLTRRAAALVIRDRAMEVSGVRSVRVSMGRHRVGVRAVSHFRELDEVREDLTEVLAVAVDELGLARPPRPQVRVTRLTGKG
ncbi:DUF6286 domain-containing protein [Streptomyces sp. NPDC097619]|uniref:DUF6286 domain-containing protein n=1 Tax=Streptomyces sp. NPDC097619 TaxID=3157228 RepID=UPI00332386F1